MGCQAYHWSNAKSWRNKHNDIYPTKQSKFAMGTIHMFPSRSIASDGNSPIEIGMLPDLPDMTEYTLLCNASFDMYEYKNLRIMSKDILDSATFEILPIYNASMLGTPASLISCANDTSRNALSYNGSYFDLIL